MVVMDVAIDFYPCFYLFDQSKDFKLTNQISAESSYQSGKFLFIETNDLVASKFLSHFILHALYRIMASSMSGVK